MRRSTYGERLASSFGSVCGSFFVVRAVISASSLLISLKIPDDVLNDVRDPIGTSFQSVVALNAPFSW